MSSGSESGASPDSDAEVSSKRIKTECLFDPTLEAAYPAVQKRILALAENQFILHRSDGPLHNQQAFLLAPPEETARSTLPHAQYKIRPKLEPGWTSLNGSAPEFTPLQTTFLPALSARQDVISTVQSIAEQKEVRRLYVMHIVNEALKTRGRILKNNLHVKLHQANSKSSSLGTEEDPARDQGFSRPKVLVLTPFRNGAFDAVRDMMTLWQASGGQVDNWSRFVKEFGGEDVEDDGEIDYTEKEEMEDANGRLRPADYMYTFRGNNDDYYRIGIKLTRKSLKLFTDFFGSDIIFASPLGLRLAIEGGTGKDKGKVEGGADFLSSIECLVIDQADVLLMQNWEHVQYIFDNLNRIPKKPRDCDFSRVKTAFLDGNGSSIRQTLIFSQFIFPELNALISSQLRNCTGRLLVRPKTYDGVLKKIQHGIKPKFHRLPVSTSSLADDASNRLDYFIKDVLARFTVGDLTSTTHICVYVSSYFDFVQIREHLESLSLSFAFISEYSDVADTTRARSRFFNGHVRFLLVSERFYFFRRPKIRGIRHLVFYGLPEYAAHFVHWVGMIEAEKATEEDGALCEAMFSTLDSIKLERIVGSKRIQPLLS